MSGTADPIELLFGGMDKLGPGSDEDTRRVLDLLPRRTFETVVDAGCGTGRQTLTLARELGTTVHAVDTHEGFLSGLASRANERGLGDLVETHAMDMAAIPQAFAAVDLLWSEGSAYNIGFAHALTLWAKAIVPGGFAVVSELSWLDDAPPQAVKAFFAAAYPDMRRVVENVATAERAGYSLLATHVLPDETWVAGFYDVLEPRAKRLMDHEDAQVRGFAEETLQEIDVFRRKEGSYGYVFYVLQRTRP